MKKSWLSLALCAVFAGIASADITLVKSGEDYRVDVPANTLADAGTLTLVWDTADKGNDYAGWTNKRELSSLTSAGGTFTTPVEGVPAGSVVRALATQSVSFFKSGSYLSVTDSKYIDTGIAENNAYGILISYNVKAQYGSGDWMSVISGTCDQFTIGCNGGDNNSFYLRYNNQDNKLRYGITANKEGGNRVEIKNKSIWVNNTLQTWNNGKTSTYNTHCLYPNGTNHIFLCSDAAHTRFTAVDWYWVIVYDASNTKVRDMWPARIGTRNGLWDWTEGKFHGAVTGGDLAITGDVSETRTMVVAASSVAVDNASLVATALWTGAAADRDPTNAANWECRDVAGEIIADALPTADTAVTFSGTVDVDFPASYTLNNRSITMNCALGSDSSWRGVFGAPAVGEELAYVDVGKGAYVDTGFKPNALTRAAIEVTVQANGTREYWFGAWNTTYNRGAFCFGNDAGSLYTGWANNGGANGSVIPVGRHVLELDKGKVVIDGAVRNTYSDNGGFPVNYPIYIFAQNRVGTAHPGDNQATIRFHGFKIYDNGTLVRDYVPMRRFSDGQMGIYEKVGRAFATIKNGGRSWYGLTQYGAGTGKLVHDVLTNAALPPNATVDVAGHKLTMSPNGTTLCAGTVTSSAENGTLALDLVEGQSFNNTQINLTGALKVEKLGAGTFTATKTGTSYTGGTDIQAGTVVTVGDPASLPFGGKQAGGNAQVFVRTGAALDLGGKTGWGWHFIKLDGGVLTGATGQANFWLELLADSAINATGDFGGGYGAINPAMNGHTLTLDVAIGKTLLLQGAVGMGKIVAHAGGTVRTKANFDNSDLEFDVQGAMFAVDHDITVKDYTSSYSLGYNAGTGRVTVVGTLAPLSNYYSGALMADGSTLDLRSYTAAWSSASQGTGDANGALSFADDAKVTIDLRGRTLALGDQVVSWLAQPANVDADTFQWDEETAANEVPVVVNARGIFYGADPNSTEVDTARWTGAAGDGDVANPANWECKNAAGRVLSGALPTGTAAIAIDGDVNLNLASGAVLNGRSLKVNCKLTDDADWRGSFVRTARKTDFIFIALGAYFNTGFCPNQNTHIAIDLTAGNTHEYWCGTWNRAYATGAFAICNDGSVIYAGYGNQGGGAGASVTVGERHVVENDKGKIIVDGKEPQHTWPANEFQCLYPLLIGAQNRTGQASPCGANGMRIHGVKIWDNDVLIRDYIPIRFEDGTGALWDTLSETCLMPTLGSVEFGCQWIYEANYALPRSGYVEAGATVGNDEYVVTNALVLAAGSSIDLNGHSLTLSGAVPPSGEVTITDTSVGEPGTLTLDIPANYTYWNSRLAIGGNVKFVKEGTGIFNSARSMDYTGGTEVKTGIYRYSIGSCSNTGDILNPGAPAGDTNTIVTVKNGASLDTWGHIGLGYNYTIEGVGVAEKGALYSSRDLSVWWAKDVLHDVVLMGDATIGSHFTFRERTITLNGHTFTMKKNDSFVYNSTFVGEGKILVDFPAGKFEPYDLDTPDKVVGNMWARDAELEIGTNTQLSVKGNVYVKDFTMAGKSIWRDANNAYRKLYRVYVSGRYTPVGAAQPPVQFTGNSGMLDISSKEDIWNADTLVDPPDGSSASVAVAFGSRKFNDGEKIVSWTTKPERLSFHAARGSTGVVTAKEDGLYFYSGMVIIVR